MSTVADLHPARTDDNGTIWFKAGPGRQDGWTADPAQADPSYAEKPRPNAEGTALVQVSYTPVAGPLPACHLCGSQDHAMGQCPEPLEPLGPRGGIRYPADPPQPPTRKEEQPVSVELTADGAPDTGRYSEFMRYPLPPLVPREECSFDGYGRYKLPSPTTGRPTSYTRATTVAGVTSDHYNLVQWKIRTKVAAVLKAYDCYTAVTNNAVTDDTAIELGQKYVTLMDAVDAGASRKINAAIDAIDDYAGGSDARELGGAVHDWLGAVDLGQVLAHQVPDQFQPYLTAYQDALARAGLIAVPDYVERLVLNDRGQETIAGRLDRIYRCVATGELYLGDLKTSKTLDFSHLEYGIQFAIYGWATLMLGLDGLTWEPMPEINNEMALCVHVPSDQPERSQVVPFNLWAGGEYTVTALQVRAERKDAPKTILGQTTPIPTKEALRYVAARQAIQNIHDADDARGVMEEYRDVWDDELSQFGAQCFELLTPANASNKGA